ncbi:NAD(+)/NADH kinase [Desulfogranum mediterraneum]|uniref:NAD(+)/NADH kinase n=1 Tax=Desulfogranum mediterraneum TaxID=160661 RepID=UPI0004288BC5|nr:NAD(+)/NADH kinase [Desulfogranum mediterraneum]
MIIKRAGVITRHDSPEVEKIGHSLLAWFSEREVEAQLNQVQPEMDMLVVLGGDGTLLHVAKEASTSDIPILGVNLGDLGFLTEVAADELYYSLETVLAGDYRLEERIMLAACVVHGTDGAKSAPVYALNEVVIVKDSTEHMVRLRCWADKEYITTYRADGLILATPTGSTAYNLSAGGPIVHAELDTMVVTPICPFMLESRPVLLAPQTRITTQLMAPAGEVKVIVDGNLQWKISEDDYLLVQKASKPLLLISSPLKSYFTILRNKLNWGGSRVDLPLPELVCRHC